jgi:hypothetical protein
MELLHGQGAIVIVSTKEYLLVTIGTFLMKAVDWVTKSLYQAATALSAVQFDKTNRLDLREKWVITLLILLMFLGMFGTYLMTMVLFG